MPASVACSCCSTASWSALYRRMPNPVNQARYSRLHFIIHRSRARYQNRSHDHHQYHRERQRNPGKNPPMYSRPIDSSTSTPKIINPMLGGIKMPKVPPAASDPITNRSLYPRCRNDGSDTRLMVAGGGHAGTEQAAKTAQDAMFRVQQSARQEYQPAGQRPVHGARPCPSAASTRPSAGTAAPPPE